MSICVGWNKAAEIKHVVCLALILTFGVACSNGESQLEDVPIEVSQPGSQVVDVNLVVANAHDKVDEVLPGSNLTFFSLVADCKNLSELQGEITLFFSQTQSSFFGERTFTARVVINTGRQQLQLKVRDETEQQLSVEPLDLDGISILEIASTLEIYLSSRDKCDGTVVMTRSGTENPWGVRCGPPDQVFIRCLEIDPQTGIITEPR